MSKTRHIVSLDQLLEYIGGQFARIESKLDSITTGFVTRREIESVQQDIDRAHAKFRELEERIRVMEIADAGDRAENKGRFTYAEKIGGIVVALLTAAAIVGLGLR